MTTQQAASRNDHPGDEPDAGPPDPPGRSPLVLTVSLAQPAQGLFQSLRDRHFPAGRNLVPAHVSLFHALPGAALEPIRKRLRRLELEFAPVRIEAPFPLGRGVAFRLEAPSLAALHATLAADWRDWLTPQDRQPWRPHVTVQNKVEPEAARRLLARLADGFVPFTSVASRLRLWRYVGGPWEALDTLPFPAEAPAPGAGGVAGRRQEKAKGSAPGPR